MNASDMAGREIEISRLKLKLEPLLDQVAKLSLMEAASLISTIGGRVHDAMTRNSPMLGDQEFAFWWFTINRGLLRSIPEGSIQTEVRMNGGANNGKH